MGEHNRTRTKSSQPKRERKGYRVISLDTLFTLAGYHLPQKLKLGTGMAEGKEAIRFVTSGYFTNTVDGGDAARVNDIIVEPCCLQHTRLDRQGRQGMDGTNKSWE